MLGRFQRDPVWRLPRTGVVPVALAAMLLAAPVAAGGGTVGADIIGNAGRPFVANVVVQADGQTLTGRLYHRPGMQRQEFDRSSMVRIVRFDRGEVWTLDLEARTVRRTPLDASGDIVGSLRRDALSLVRLGRETQGGLDAEILTFRGTGAETTLDGTLWVGRDGILLRQEMIAHRLSETHQIRFELDGVQLTDVPAQLFEAPRGFRAAPAGPVWTPPAGATRRGQRVGHRPAGGRLPGKGASGQDGPSGASAGNPASLEELFRSRRD